MAQHEIYGLIGFPLGHSFSRDYFTEKFARLGIDAEYRNFEIDDIGALMELIAELPDLRGFNVTTPYKTQIIPFLNRLSPEAEAIGAVNTVKLTNMPDAPLLLGFNTDAPAFADDVSPLLANNPQSALVLGSGGASRAVCHALRSLGISPVVVSRTPAEDQISYGDITPEIMEKNLLLVNTTPLGMWPETDRCPPIPYQLVTPRHAAYDLVYNPSVTLFMQKCSQQGAAVRCGEGMLHRQADLAWQIWTDPDIH